MSWAVIIPSDSADRLDKSLRTVFKAHPGLSAGRIHVVSHKLKQPVFPATHPAAKINLIHDPESAFCYARRINLALRKLRDKDCVIMGDDIEVITPKAFDLMAQEAPLRLIASRVQGRVGPSWQKDEGIFLDVPFVSFTCVYLPSTVLEIVGFLEESFPGYGYEDTDYCIRVRRAGLSVGVCHKALVAHNVGIPSNFVEAYGAKLSLMEADSRKAFIRKWQHRGIM